MRKVNQPSPMALPLVTPWGPVCNLMLVWRLNGADLGHGTRGDRFPVTGSLGSPFLAHFRDFDSQTIPPFGTPSPTRSR